MTQKFTQINGVPFPEFLFKTKSSNKNKSVSPTATLDPTKAIRGNGWESSIDPTGAIIFDKRSFAESENMQETIPLIAKLKSAGFNVYILCGNSQDKYLKKVEDDLSGLPGDLKQLKKFDEKTDYALAARHNIAYDKTILMNYEKVRTIKDGLTQTNQGKDELYGNHLEARFLTTSSYHYSEEPKAILSRRFFTIEPQLYNAQNAQEDGAITPGFLETATLEAIKERFEIIKKDRLQDDAEEVIECNFKANILIILRDNNIRLTREEVVKWLTKPMEKPLSLYEVNLPLWDILKVINQFPDLQKVFFEDNVEDYDPITNIDDLRKVLEAIPNSPNLQEELINKYSELITDSDHLCSVLEEIDRSPNLQEELINQHSELITEFYDLRNVLQQIRSSATLQEELINKYSELITEGDHLRNVLYGGISHSPTLQEKLINKYSELITAENLYHVLLAAPNSPSLQEEFMTYPMENFNDLSSVLRDISESESFQKRLIIQHSTLITEGDHLCDILREIRKLPNLQEEMINKYSYLITNSNHLSGVLNKIYHSPYLQERLINDRSGLIKNVDGLLEILQVIPNSPNLQEKLINEHLRLKKNNNDLCNISTNIQKLPRLQKKLIKSFLKEAEGRNRDDLINHAEFKKELAMILLRIPNLPSFYKKLLTDYKDILPNITQHLLNRHVTIWQSKPEIMEMVIDECNIVPNCYYLEENIKLQNANHDNLESNVKPSSLYIFRLYQGNINQLSKNYGDYLSEVAVLKIMKVDDIEVMKQLVREFPKICHFILPNEMIETFKKTFPNKSCESGSLDMDIFSTMYEKSERSEGNQTSANENRNYNAESKNTQYDNQTSRHGNKDGYAKRKFNTSNGLKTSVPNVKIATILNDESAENPDIRIKAINRNIGASLDEKDYMPSAKNLIATQDGNKKLTFEDIETFKSRPKDTELYYLMGAELKKDTLVRLPCASTEEEFMGFYTKTSGVKIETFKEDDGFLYAKANKNCEISFVTKVDQQKINDYNKIDDNPHIKIIKEYLRNEKYQINADPNQEFPEYDPNHHAEWLQNLFDNALGVCRHRVAAVEYVLKKGNPPKTPAINSEDIRIININTNHVILEIKHDEKWYPIDLGGGGSISGEIDHTNNLKLPKKDEDKNLETKESKQSFLELDLEERLRNIIEPKAVINQKDQLLEKTLAVDKKKILLITHKNNDSHANFLLKEARNLGRKFFYIDSPEKIDLNQANILIDENGVVNIGQNSQLNNFLLSITNEDENPLLLINWDKFNAKEKLALNSVIDRYRSIGGKKIPENLQIIGLNEVLPKDISFLSRHELTLRSNIPANELEIEEKKEAEESKDQVNYKNIDLEGFTDYRAKFFGRVPLHGDHLEWKQSEFVEALKNGQTKFEISNIDSESYKKLEYEFKQAKATGYLNYYGHKIALNQNVEISLGAKKEYDFSTFNNYQIVKDVTYGELQPKEDFHIINSQLFDHLLYDKKIEGELYYETAGLIEKAKNNTLNLFITSNLSNGQYYILFKRASELGVKLNIALANDIQVPHSLKISQRTETKAELLESKTPKIIVTNNILETTNQEIKAGEKVTIIDIEDFTYQDLATRVEFEFKDNVFNKFKIIESELLKKLKSANGKVILRGEFSPELLQMIHPILLYHGEEFKAIANNLTVIIEDKNISDKQTNCDYLNFISSKDGYKIKCHKNTETKAQTPKIFSENNAEFNANAQDSEAEVLAKSQSFIDRRKAKFKEFIATNSLLKLSGHSGVGKSRLIEEIEKEDEITVYHELAGFEKFAEDKSDKTKFIFFDEANIDDVHFTRFSQLKNGAKGIREVLINGKLYPLTDKHIIGFAGNDPSYGGGRIEQKLFADGSIPEMQFSDFPTSYIYQKLLKELIYDQCEPDIKDIVSVKDFQTNCLKFIDEYQNYNKSQNDRTKHLTVRELQEKTLRYLSKEYSKVEEKKTGESKESEFFVFTKATKEAEDNLRTAIAVRTNKLLPKTALGTNGVLLQGDSGIGKSELVKIIFEENHIGEATIDTKIDDNKKYYYRIDSSMPLEKKKELIIKAFNEGNMIWIDEINSCIDTGLEKILNAVLTGMHPDTKKPASKAGFMMVATANEIDMEGRSLISPALMHRLSYTKMKSLNEYDNDDITAIVSHLVKDDEKQKENVPELVQVFKSLRKEYGPFFNLRVFDNILKDHIKAIDQTNPKSAQTKTPKNSISDPSLEAITVNAQNNMTTVH